RAALCARIETLVRSESGSAGTADLEQARAEWNRLPPLPEQWGGELRRRFATACERLAARTRERMAAQAARGELQAPGQEAESLAGTTRVTSPKTWKALVARWESHRAALPAGCDVDPLAPRFAAAEERILERWREAERDRTKLETENVKRLEALCARIEELAG